MITNAQRLTQSSVAELVNWHRHLQSDGTNHSRDLMDRIERELDRRDAERVGGIARAARGMLDRATGGAS